MPAGSGGSSGNGGSGGMGGSDCGKTCAELGWACGYAVDSCGNVIDCADEGLSCSPLEVCLSNEQNITECVAGFDGGCDVCEAVVDCSAQAQPTRLVGRVVTPGRDDADTANQVGVPNAVVYILRREDPEALPDIAAGVPQEGMACERCEEVELGPVLVGAVTDATGRFELEGDVPVGRDFLLVVRAGKFRRAVLHQIPTDAACTTVELPTALPDNPTRLPRSKTDGLAAHLPRIAISTGGVDAIECVFEKMGIAHSEFGNAETAARVHLYRGGVTPFTASGTGPRVDSNTELDTHLFMNRSRMFSYDLVVANCEGIAWDSLFAERDNYGPNVREFVNRGGRFFASHHSFSWLYGNGTAAYDPEGPIATGLGPAADWHTDLDLTNEGTGRVSLGRSLASPGIDDFAAWMVEEGVTSDPEYTFSISDPRSQASSVGSHAEEFVYLTDQTERVQQFAFNTPYGAPDEAACGRVAYSGFHVVAEGGSGIDHPFAEAMFPEHCTASLTDQEKVLLYMLFDLGACVGEPPKPPECVPDSCDSEPNRCGFIPDRCGGLLDCGACVIPPS